MNNYQPKNSGFIDTNFSYPIANLFSHVIYKLGITPNQITIFTFIIRLIAIYYMFLKQKPELVFGLFVFSWFTDLLDGIIARKYDMKSEIGAHLDAFVDVTTVTATFIVLLMKYYNENLCEYAILLVCLGLGYLFMSIKLRADKKNKDKKPWEKSLSYIPLDLESNCLIDAIDPGFIYLIVLSGLYYGLFTLK